MEKLVSCHKCFLSRRIAAEVIQFRDILTVMEHYKAEVNKMLSAYCLLVKDCKREISKGPMKFKQGETSTSGRNEKIKSTVRENM